MSNETTEPKLTPEVLVGTLFTLMSVVECLLYVPCLIVFVMRTDPDLKSLSCFRMMFHLGLADLTALTVQGVTGLIFIAGWAFKIPYALNKLMGAVLTAYGWNWYVIQCHLIALNSCVTICLPDRYHERFFSKNGTTVWLAISFAYATAWFVALMSPFLTLILIPELHTFYYDISSPWFKLAWSLNWMADNVFVNGCGVWYRIVLIYLRIQSRSLTHQAVLTSAQQRERRVFYQVALIGFYAMVWNQYWYFSDILYEAYEFKYAYTVGNALWISNSAVNPIVYLTLNR